MSGDPVARALMAELASAIEEQVPPGAAFAIFIDWRDGAPPSYASNGARADVVKALSEWIAKREAGAPLERGYRGEVPTLESECARLGRYIEQGEDISVLLFLFTMGDHGLTTWYTSMPNARELVRGFIASQPS